MTDNSTTPEKSTLPQEFILDDVQETTAEQLETTQGIEDLGSVALIEMRRHVGADDDFVTEILDLPQGEPTVQIENGVIKLDRKVYEAEFTGVNAWLQNSIISGDEKTLQVYLRNIIGDDDETKELRKQLQEAFRSRDPGPLRLQELDVNIVSAGIAERNMIRNGLRPELTKQPFYFTDEKGTVLSGEQALDIIIARESNDGDKFKVIVGAKTGITAIHMPSELSPTMFIPVYDKISKDDVRNTISIPLKAAADGSRPSIGTVEVHLGPIDLVQLLADQEIQEKKEQQQRERKLARDKQKEAEQSSYNYNTPSYNPPAPRSSPGGWSVHSG